MKLPLNSLQIVSRTVVPVIIREDSKVFVIHVKQALLGEWYAFAESASVYLGLLKETGGVVKGKYEQKVLIDSFDNMIDKLLTILKGSIRKNRKLLLKKMSRPALVMLIEKVVEVNTHIKKKIENLPASLMIWTHGEDTSKLAEFLEKLRKSPG